MSNRVKQFVAAVSAQITAQDRVYIGRFLQPEQQQLFWRMNLPEQRHALDVAYTAQRLADGRAGLDHNALIQAALLHDVGKMRGDISIADKVMTVVADACCPRIARKLSKEGRGNKLSNLRHAMYVYYRHAERGAAMLAACGADPRLIEWVRCHHEPPSDADPTELELLKAADNLH